MPKGGARPGAGRPKGSQNADNSIARAAIADFVNGNSAKLQGWLERVAEGVKSDDDPNKWLYTPNPEKAISLLTGVMEYFVPKLARTEIQPLDENGNKSAFSITINHVKPNDKA